MQGEVSSILWIAPPDGCNDWGGIRLKPRTWGSVWVSHGLLCGCQGFGGWAIFCCCPRHVSRELETRRAAGAQTVLEASVAGGGLTNCTTMPAPFFTAPGKIVFSVVQIELGVVGAAGHKTKC